MSKHGGGAETLILKEGGRVVIPAAMRAALGIAPGDELLARVENGELRITTRAASIRRIQERLAKYKKPGESVVDEFLAERRAMWGEE
jgi:AbrB family looped-hinge helix DNA binding protein